MTVCWYILLSLPMMQFLTIKIYCCSPPSLPTFLNRTLYRLHASENASRATVKLPGCPYNPSSLNLSSLFLCSTFVTVSFLLCGVVNPTPNLQPGGPGYTLLSGSSPLTCLAWEAVPVAHASTSIALGII